MRFSWILCMLSISFAFRLFLHSLRLFFFLFHYTYIICCSSQNDVDDQDSSKFSNKKRRKQTSWTKMKKKWKKLMYERLFIFYFCCLLYNKGMWIRFGWMEYLCAVWDSGWMLWMGLRVSNLLRIFVLKILRIFVEIFTYNWNYLTIIPIDCNTIYIEIPTPCLSQSPQSNFLNIIREIKSNST